MSAITTRNCQQCGSAFAIRPQEENFYANIQVPSPRSCPDCRQQSRLALINQVNLFKSKCAATGQSIITPWPENSPYKIYSQPYWWSDEVDNCIYARDYDFSRPFFEQYRSLQLAVPRPALFTDYSRDENSAYTNYAGRNKNCYLIFDSDENRDCYYSYSLNSCVDCSDCYRGEQMQLCYEAVDCRNCYNCAFIFNSDNCRNSYFLNNCLSCTNCLLCSNLRQKEYHVLNEKVSPEEFERFRQLLSRRTGLSELLAQFVKFKKRYPQKAMRGFQNEDCLGNYLNQSRSAYMTFDSRQVWDVSFCYQAFMALKNSSDVDECGEGELIYQCSNLGFGAYNIRFSHSCLNQISDLTYCELCFNGCKNLFGCIGLKRQEYCILNKQYSKDEYHSLVGKITQQMISSGEWGEYFPASCSTVAYNLSMAQDYFPLTKEQARAKGYHWHEQEHLQRTALGNLPQESINDCDEASLKCSYSCQDCGKDFKLITQELALLKNLELAPPTSCFHCRHRRRMNSRSKRKLWASRCHSCHREITTALHPEDGDIANCESCFLESFH